MSSATAMTPVGPVSEENRTTGAKLQPTSFCLAELAGELKPEPICAQGVGRFVLFPLKYPEVWEHYKKSVACFWTAEEVDLAHDMRDWEALADDERHFISHILAFFAAADGIVNENLSLNFAEEVTMPEARCFYGFQMAIENIHWEVYSLLIDTYIKNAKEKERLFNALTTIPAVKRKADCVMKYMDTRYASFAERIVAFVCAEGLAFSGSFCAIYWLKKRGKMPGLCFANELISRDEGLHCDFGCLLYSMLENRLPDKRVHEILTEFYAAEVEFITSALPVELIGMNSSLMIEYIKTTANVLCKGLNAPSLFPGATNPFDWMSLIDIDGKTNYFERRVGEYNKAWIDQSSSASKILTFDDEF